MTLTNPEKSVLAECEAIVERGLESFVEVGNAMLRIRNERLYRAEFGTFQEYCESRWQMSRIHAHRMIEAAEVVENLLPMGNIPISERSVRPLVSLRPKQQREAWQAAVESSPTGKPTAKEVEAAVHRIDPSRIRPISPVPATKEQQEVISDAEKDSENLWLLKSYWKKATKAERTLFRAWISEN